MKFGSRTFTPRPFTTGLTLLLMLALVCLGRWQLGRAEQKRALYDAFDKGTDATRVIDWRTPPLPRYQHVEVRGSYDGAHQILIDNMTDAAGHAGYFVVTPLKLLDGGWVLVNRGWVPLGASRAVLPRTTVAGDVREVRGRADHLPTPGIRMGTPAKLMGPFPVVANFPTRGDIERLVQKSPWTSATDLVLLDADQPDGYLRQWQAPGLPPLRHVAYAVQWFGLALALGVIYIVTNLGRAAPKAAA
jgi:surfeit locus 1 family protein